MARTQNTLNTDAATTVAPVVVDEVATDDVALTELTPEQVAIGIARQALVARIGVDAADNLFALGMTLAELHSFVQRHDEATARAATIIGKANAEAEAIRAEREHAERQRAKDMLIAEALQLTTPEETIETAKEAGRKAIAAAKPASNRGRVNQPRYVFSAIYPTWRINAGNASNDLLTAITGADAFVRNHKSGGFALTLTDRIAKTVKSFETVADYVAWRDATTGRFNGSGITRQVAI